MRSVAAALTGDAAGARRVEPVLPETGVCSAGSPERGGCDGEEEEGVARPEPVLAAAGAACCG